MYLLYIPALYFDNVNDCFTLGNVSEKKKLMLINDNQRY